MPPEIGWAYASAKEHDSVCLVVLPGGPAESLSIRELRVERLRPAACNGVVRFGRVDQLSALYAEFVKRNCAEVDEAEVYGGEQDAMNLPVHLELGEWFESGLERDIMEDRLHESAVEGCAGVERRDEDTGIVGDRTEARIALGVGVEFAAAEGEVMDAMELKPASPGH